MRKTKTNPCLPDLRKEELLLQFGNGHIPAFVRRSDRHQTKYIVSQYGRYYCNRRAIIRKSELLR